jgi:16S rRNA (cytidine1402-2'-O)-methyltransferase
MTIGKIYLIPSALSEDNSKVLPQNAIDIVNSLNEFIVENERTARHFLKGIGIQAPLQSLQLHLLNEHTNSKDIFKLLEPVLSGKNVGLLSEAGTPAVADPGSDLIRSAHEKGIEVIPLIGPSSIIMALMASGLNGQSFSFIGYLPKEKNERIKNLKELEKQSLSKNQTQIFIEAPYRNQHLLEDILSTCEKRTALCIACNITANDEFIKTKTIEEWKKRIPVINKRPTVFLIGK